MSLALDRPSRTSVSGAHLAAFATFLMFGMVTGLWGGAMPEIVRQAGVTPRLTGMALSFFMLAYVVSMSTGGWFARRISLRRIMLVAFPAAAVLLGLLLQARSPEIFFVAFTLFGFVGGMIDLTMNAEGTRVEADRGRPILAGLHGGASLGMAGGAITASLLAATLGTLAVALVGTLACALAMAALLTGTPDRGIDPPPAAAVRGGGGGLTVLVLIGLVVGISMAGEMTASAWSAPLLIAQAPELAAFAGTGAAVFSLAQALIRFQADALRRRLGDPLLLMISLSVAMAGLAIVAASSGFGPTAAGFALVGLGTACVVPCGFSYAAARSPLAPSAALAIVSLASAVPRLPTPWLVGEIATRASIGPAFGLLAALFAAAIGVALVLRRSEPQAA